MFLFSKTCIKNQYNIKDNENSLMKRWGIRKIM